jgi:hypothetical protein
MKRNLSEKETVLLSLHKIPVVMWCSDYEAPSEEYLVNSLCAHHNIYPLSSRGEPYLKILSLKYFRNGSLGEIQMFIDNSRCSNINL